MTHYFIIPGYQGSGLDHWQTWIQSKEPHFTRIEQRNWNEPNLEEWANQIEHTIANYNPQSVVLVAHSMGCHAVAEWSRRFDRAIKAALLVAPPDALEVEAKILNCSIQQASFSKLPFRTALVASTNDPWISIDTAQSYAQSWGSDLVNIGDAGHINNLSGYGEWEQGYEILKKLGN